jgi:PAS domain S-box-containing protein
MDGPTNGGRARAYQPLHDSEELHRITLSSISDAVFLTDDDGAFTFTCPNVDVIFGYAPDQVQAMSRISQLLGENLFDRAELRTRREIRNIERDVTSKSGERRCLLIHLKEVSIQGGTVLYSCRRPPRIVPGVLYHQAGRGRSGPLHRPDHRRVARGPDLGRRRRRTRGDAPRVAADGGAPMSRETNVQWPGGAQAAAGVWR